MSIPVLARFGNATQFDIHRKRRDRRIVSLLSIHSFVVLFDSIVGKRNLSAIKSFRHTIGTWTLTGRLIIQKRAKKIEFRLLSKG